MRTEKSKQETQALRFRCHACVTHTRRASAATMTEPGNIPRDVLEKAAKGASEGRGGLNVPAIHKVLEHYGLPFDKKASRGSLQIILCQHLRIDVVLPSPVEEAVFTTERLNNAVNGKTVNNNGLNIAHIVRYLTERGLEFEKGSPRSDLNRILAIKLGIAATRWEKVMKEWARRMRAKYPRRPAIVECQVTKHQGDKPNVIQYIVHRCSHCDDTDPGTNCGLKGTRKPLTICGLHWPVSKAKVYLQHHVSFCRRMRHWDPSVPDIADVISGASYLPTCRLYHTPRTSLKSNTDSLRLNIRNMLLALLALKRFIRDFKIGTSKFSEKLIHHNITSRIIDHAIGHDGIAISRTYSDEQINELVRAITTSGALEDVVSHIYNKVRREAREKRHNNIHAYGVKGIDYTSQNSLIFGHIDALVRSGEKVKKARVPVPRGQSKWAGVAVCNIPALVLRRAVAGMSEKRNGLNIPEMIGVICALSNARPPDSEPTRVMCNQRLLALLDERDAAATA